MAWELQFRIVDGGWLAADERVVLLINDIILNERSMDDILDVLVAAGRQGTVDEEFRDIDVVSLLKGFLHRAWARRCRNDAERRMQRPIATREELS